MARLEPHRGFRLVPLCGQRLPARCHCRSSCRRSALRLRGVEFMGLGCRGTLGDLNSRYDLQTSGPEIGIHRLTSRGLGLRVQGSRIFASLDKELRAWV